MSSSADSALLRSFTDSKLRSKQMKDFHPQAIVDGSKLIFRLGKTDRLHFDNPTKIILSSPKLKQEQSTTWQTSVTFQDPRNLVVLDSCYVGQRFFPIALNQYGTVYTRPGTVHVVLGNVRRHKVNSRSLPYRTCNKFENATGDQAPPYEDQDSVGAAVPEGLLYIRSDESLTRYRLSKNDALELHSGRVIAWTLGVRFEFKSYCCFRFVSAVSGDGTIWVHNSRTRTPSAAAPLE